MNNHPESLRWITRLENILLNPITLKRVLEAYGSVEEFFVDPMQPKHKSLSNKYDWMRTVSVSEAADRKLKLENWAASSTSTAGTGLGEWLFQHRTQVVTPKVPEIFSSLTEGAAQINWRTPSEFPCCPVPGKDHTLMDYFRALSFGAVFCSERTRKAFLR